MGNAVDPQLRPGEAGNRGHRAWPQAGGRHPGPARRAPASLFGRGFPRAAVRAAGGAHPSRDRQEDRAAGHGDAADPGDGRGGQGLGRHFGRLHGLATGTGRCAGSPAARTCGTGAAAAAGR